jgi:hypothetical protein
LNHLGGETRRKEVYRLQRKKARRSFQAREDNVPPEVTMSSRRKRKKKLWPKMR